MTCWSTSVFTSSLKKTTTWYSFSPLLWTSLKYLNTNFSNTNVVRNVWHSHNSQVYLVLSAYYEMSAQKLHSDNTNVKQNLLLKNVYEYFIYILPIVSRQEPYLSMDAYSYNISLFSEYEASLFLRSPYLKVTVNKCKSRRDVSQRAPNMQIWFLVRHLFGHSVQNWWKLGKSNMWTSVTRPTINHKGCWCQGNWLTECVVSMKLHHFIFCVSFLCCVCLCVC